MANYEVWLDKAATAKDRPPVSPSTLAKDDSEYGKFANWRIVELSLSEDCKALANSSVATDELVFMSFHANFS